MDHNGPTSTDNSARKRIHAGEEAAGESALEFPRLSIIAERCAQPALCGCVNEFLGQELYMSVEHGVD